MKKQEEKAIKRAFVIFLPHLLPQYFRELYSYAAIDSERELTSYYNWSIYYNWSKTAEQRDELCLISHSYLFD